MTLDTYANLQVEVLAKLNRAADTDAQTRVLTWITLAEDEMRMALNRLKVRQGETSNTSFSITTEYTALPAGYYAMRTNPKLNTSPVATLEYVTPRQADAWDPYANAAQPRLWTVQQNQLRVFPPPDTAYTASLFYYAFPSLSGSVASNWLLAAHPKLYFKATLAEAYDYYEDDDRMMAASAERDRMFSAIYTSDGSDQQGVSMRIRPDNGSP